MLLILTLLVFAIVICIVGVILVFIVSLIHRNDGITRDSADHLNCGDLEDPWEAPAEDEEEWVRASEDNNRPLSEEDAKDTADAIVTHLRDLEQEHRR